MCTLHLSTGPKGPPDTAPGGIPMAKNESAKDQSIQQYFESLLSSYDVMVEAVEKANERGLKVSKAFSDDVVKGQREAIELGKKLSGEPTDVGLFYTAI